MNLLITLVQVIFLGLFFFLLSIGKPMLWFGLFAASLLAALVFGRVYCGYICPMNTLMIPTDKLAKKFKLQTDKVPKWLESGAFAWFALFASLASMVVFKKFLHKDIPILLVWIVLSLVITLRYQAHVFHNYICPFTPLQKIFGSFAFFSEKVEPEACIGCKLCERVCPSAAIEVKADKKALIDKSLCFQCTSCQQVCPTEAIRYQRS